MSGRYQRSESSLDRLAGSQGDRQRAATAQATAAQNVATTRRSHAAAETMYPLAAADFGLPGSLNHTVYSLLFLKSSVEVTPELDVAGITGEFQDQSIDASVILPSVDYMCRQGLVSN